RDLGRVPAVVDRRLRDDRLAVGGDELDPALLERLVVHRHLTGDRRLGTAGTPGEQGERRGEGASGNESGHGSGYRRGAAPRPGAASRAAPGQLLSWSTSPPFIVP